MSLVVHRAGQLTAGVKAGGFQLKGKLTALFVLRLFVNFRDTSTGPFLSVHLKGYLFFFLMGEGECCKSGSETFVIDLDPDPTYCRRKVFKLTSWNSLQIRPHRLRK
jgi:hypothetical protein